MSLVVYICLDQDNSENGMWLECELEEWHYLIAVLHIEIKRKQDKTMHPYDK